MKLYANILICAVFPILLGCIPLAVQETQGAAVTSSEGQRVFVFFQRTESHVKRSTSAVFHEVLDDVQGYLKIKNVAMAVDEFGGKSDSEDVTPLSTVHNIARDAGANYLLYVEVDRPVTKWIKVRLRCYDMAGKTLWEEEASNGGGLSGASGLRATLDKIHKKLDARLGQPGLPIKAATEKPPFRQPQPGNK
jgi:hypothetical protein